jgi:hypothetical protein
VKRVFVASPLRAAGDFTFEGNLDLARRLCLRVVEMGNAPFAPHLLYTQFLDDDDEIHRAKGIACGETFLEVCDELWAYCFREGGPSSGMRYEIDMAERCGIDVLINPVCWSDIR